MDIKKLRELITLLKVKPLLAAVYFNGNGSEYITFAGNKKFSKKVTREEILAQEKDLPEEEAAPAKTAADLDNIEKLSKELEVINNRLNDANIVAGKAEVEKNEALDKVKALEAERGEIIDGETEDDIKPRAESWLAERRNWASQVESLNNHIQALEKDKKDNATQS